MDAESVPRSGAHEAAVAPAPIWVRSSTLDVSPAARFDYHRALALAIGARVERLHASNAPFFAQNKSTVTPDGIGFADLMVDPCVTHFGAGGDDLPFEIGVLCAGTMYVHHGKDEARVVRSGDGLLLLDATQRSTMRTTRCAAVQLQLPRTAVAAAMGREAMSRRAALRRVAAGALTTQLAQCLWSLRGNCGYGAERVYATLRTARALALVALAKTRGAGHRWPDELERALYLAACHQLVQAVGNPRVTVDAVAATLQCSRAQLYRAFAARGQSIASYLRELRMQRAAAWLVDHPGMAIGTIADGCGYSELIAFDKAFRRHFGATPRDWRAGHVPVPGVDVGRGGDNSY